MQSKSNTFYKLPLMGTLCIQTTHPTPYTNLLADTANALTRDGIKKECTLPGSDKPSLFTSSIPSRLRPVARHRLDTAVSYTAYNIELFNDLYLTLFRSYLHSYRLVPGGADAWRPRPVHPSVRSSTARSDPPVDTPIRPGAVVIGGAERRYQRKEVYV